MMHAVLFCFDATVMLRVGQAAHQIEVQDVVSIAEKAAQQSSAVSGNAPEVSECDCATLVERMEA